MTRENAMEMLRADIDQACTLLSLERLIVARNLVRCLLDEQDAEYRARRNSEIRVVAAESLPVARAVGAEGGLAPLAKTRCDTPYEPLKARLRGR